jgi:hypothetical protein
MPGPTSTPVWPLNLIIMVLLSSMLQGKLMRATAWQRAIKMSRVTSTNHVPPPEIIPSGGLASASREGPQRGLKPLPAA